MGMVVCFRGRVGGSVDRGENHIIIILISHKKCEPNSICGKNGTLKYYLCSLSHDAKQCQAILPCSHHSNGNTTSIENDIIGSLFLLETIFVAQLSFIPFQHATFIWILCHSFGCILLCSDTFISSSQQGTIDWSSWCCLNVWQWYQRWGCRHWNFVVVFHLHCLE